MPTILYATARVNLIFSSLLQIVKLATLKSLQCSWSSNSWVPFCSPVLVIKLGGECGSAAWKGSPPSNPNNWHSIQLSSGSLPSADECEQYAEIHEIVSKD